MIRQHHLQTIHKPSNVTAINCNFVQKLYESLWNVNRSDISQNDYKRSISSYYSHTTDAYEFIEIILFSSFESATLFLSLIALLFFVTRFLPDMLTRTRQLRSSD